MGIKMRTLHVTFKSAALTFNYNLFICLPPSLTKVTLFSLPGNPAAGPLVSNTLSQTAHTHSLCVC